MFEEGLGVNKTYIAAGYTDLRQGVDGLASLIQSKYQLSPFDEGTCFFSAAGSQTVSRDYYEGGGFLLLCKRIEKGRYVWPWNKDELKYLAKEQYSLLMKVLTFDPLIKEVKYTRYQ